MEKHIVEALAEALGHIPGGEVTGVHRELCDEPHVEALIDADIAGRSVRLVVKAQEWTASPRDLRENIDLLRDYLQRTSQGQRQSVAIVAAPSLSLGDRGRLQQAGIGYFDRGGSILIPIPGSFVFIDKPPPKSSERKASPFFSGRRALVLHAVWEKSGDWFTADQVAGRAGVSPATASYTLIEMERQKWLRVRTIGTTKERALVAPDRLLDAWSEFQRSATSQNQMEYCYVQNPHAGRLEALARQHSALYALTCDSAANVYSPLQADASQIYCRLEFGARGELVLRDMDALRVREGWNVALIRPKDKAEFRFRERRGEVWIVSLLQTYLDLVQSSEDASLIEDFRVETLKAW